MNYLELTNGGPQHAAAAEFRRAAALVRQLSDADFRAVDAHTGSLGQQFRHDIDAARCLLRALAAKPAPAEVARMDYAARDRDPRLETDRAFAAATCDVIARALESVEATRLGEPVLVRSETRPEIWFGSTVGRELEFLHGHTVHHHAIIGEKIRARGVAAPGTSFGVAPSTLRHRRGEADGTTQKPEGENKLCPVTQTFSAGCSESSSR